MFFRCQDISGLIQEETMENINKWLHMSLNKLLLINARIDPDDLQVGWVVRNRVKLFSLSRVSGSFASFFAYEGFWVFVAPSLPVAFLSLFVSRSFFSFNNFLSPVLLFLTSSRLFLLPASFLFTFLWFLYLFGFLKPLWVSLNLPGFPWLV